MLNGNFWKSLLNCLGLNCLRTCLTHLKSYITGEDCDCLGMHSALGKSSKTTDAEKKD